MFRHPLDPLLTEQAPAKTEAEAAAKVEAVPAVEAAAITSTHPNKERTFLMLKPDAVQRGLAGQIIGRFEKKGFKLVAMKVMVASTDLLKQHYADLAKKPFFPELVRCARNSSSFIPSPHPDCLFCRCS